MTSFNISTGGEFITIEVEESERINDENAGFIRALALTSSGIILLFLTVIIGYLNIIKGPLNYFIFLEMFLSPRKPLSTYWSSLIASIVRRISSFLSNLFGKNYYDLANFKPIDHCKY